MARCSCSSNTHADAKNPLRQNYCNENLECHHNISSNRNEYVNVSSMFRRTCEFSKLKALLHCFVLNVKTIPKQSARNVAKCNIFDHASRILKINLLRDKFQQIA